MPHQEYPCPTHIKATSVKGVSRKIITERRSGEAVAAGQLGALLALDGPGLERDGEELKCHDEGCEAHPDGEGEHGVDVVELHGLDHVAGLWFC